MNQKTLHNDVAMPWILYGTAWKKDATKKLTESALEAGFVGIDTANQLKHYDEKLVGEAVRQWKQAKGIAREQLFLQTKFTSMDGQDHRLPYDPAADLSTQVSQSVRSSLEHLDTDFLDCYLLHGPFTRGKLTDDDWTVWQAIEEVYRTGLARSIGVSNFTADQLKELCARAEVKPMVVQNRCYAALQWDHEVRQVCEANRVVYQGFSLLTANARELTSPPVRGIAARLGATVAQVVFAFARQIGMVPLTGTTDRRHMDQDLAAAEMELTADEMHLLEHIAHR